MSNLDLLLERIGTNRIGENGKADGLTDGSDGRTSDQQNGDDNGEDFNRDQEGEQEEEGRVTARPRRLSELNIVEKVKPIPPYSSLFLFQHTNK